MKIPGKLITVSLISLFSAINLTGCSQLMSSRMPSGSLSMKQAYNDAINGTTGTDSGTLKQVRAKVHTLPTNQPNYRSLTRTPDNEIDSLFSRLPNPTIVMYVYPHEAGISDNRTPVPGYSTVFPLYTQVYYAMPG